MPLVRIEMLKGKSSEYKKAVLDEVHHALVDALKIPDYDRIQRLYELERNILKYHQTNQKISYLLS